jgi:hypothetical protein
LLGFAAFVALRMGLFDSLGIDTSPLTRFLGGRNSSDVLNTIFKVAGVATGVDVEMLPAIDSGANRASFTVDLSRWVSIGNLLGGSSIGEAQLDQLLSSGTLAEMGVQDISLDYRQSTQELVITVTAPQEALDKLANGDLPLQEIIQTALGDVDLSNLLKGLGQ